MAKKWRNPVLKRIAAKRPKRSRNDPERAAKRKNRLERQGDGRLDNKPVGGTAYHRLIPGKTPQPVVPQKILGNKRAPIEIAPGGYDRRDAAIRRMGFQNYGFYLKSPTWDQIRKRVLSRDQHTCLMCGRRAWMAHHIHYTDAALRGLNINQIVSLCGPCHSGLHIGKNQRHRPLEVVARDLGRQFSDKGIDGSAEPVAAARQTGQHKGNRKRSRSQRAKASPTGQ